MSAARQLLVYARGGHGFGLDKVTTRDRWLDRTRYWLAAEGSRVPEPAMQEMGTFLISPTSASAR